MRILTQKGTLVEVMKVEPFVEARVQFNGSEVRLCQITQDIKRMSGLYFTVAVSENGMGFLNSNTVMIGNLKQESSEEIMYELLTKGYADLSVLEYQPAAEQDKLPIFDEGKTLPYYIDASMNAMLYAPARADIALNGNAPFTMGMGMTAGRDIWEKEEQIGADDEPA